MSLKQIKNNEEAKTRTHNDFFPLQLRNRPVTELNQLHSLYIVVSRGAEVPGKNFLKCGA